MTTRNHPFLYPDAIHLKLRESRHVRKCAVYVALALNREGHVGVAWAVGRRGRRREVLAIDPDGAEESRAEDVLIAAVDGLEGFPDVIAVIFPPTQVQLCVVHMVRNSLRYVSWKHRKAVARDLRKIYTAPTVDAAEAALEALSETWDEVRRLSSAGSGGHTGRTSSRSSTSRLRFGRSSTRPMRSNDPGSAAEGHEEAGCFPDRHVRP